MSAVATKPALDPGPASHSRLLRILGSSVGLKIIMALTGVILSGFVLGHMLGNLQIFQGSKAVDEYSQLLHREPALLWAARLVLLASVGAAHLGVAGAPVEEPAGAAGGLPDHVATRSRASPHAR